MRKAEAAAKRHSGAKKSKNNPMQSSALQEWS
jgi:hypothetical protein